MLNKPISRVVKPVSVALAAILLLALFAARTSLLGGSGGETIGIHNPDGVFDLSVANLDDRAYRLTGAAFYPNAYINPADIATAGPPQPFSECQYATERLVMRVPGDCIYTLRFMLPGYAGRVYINGELVRQIGRIGTTRADIAIDYKWCVIQAAPKDGVIDLVIQAANFVRANRGVEAPEITIARASFFEPENLLTNFTSVMTMGGLFGASLLLLGIWLFNPRLTQNLWFSLECAVMAVRAGLTGDTIQRVFTVLPRWLALRVEYASTPLLMIFLTLYFDQVFPGVYQKLVRYAILGFAAAYCVTLFTLPTEVVSAWFNVSYACVGGIILYFIVRLCMKLRSPSVDQWLSLAGVGVFFFGALADLVYFSGLLPFHAGEGTIIESALMVFVLFQMVALFTGNAVRTSHAIQAERRIAAEKEAVDRISRLKTEFMGNISHEFKTPLTVMSGYAQESRMKLAAGADPELIEHHMKLIASEADRLALMVSQVLDITRIDEGRMSFNMRESDLVEIVQTTLQTYYPVFAKNNNTLELSPVRDAPIVMCDRQRISQVIVNLLSNAVHHTRNGRITLSIWQDGGLAEVTVSDTGCGIPPERISTIFQRYRTYAADKEAHTGADAGTGLGLFVSKYIIEEHGGHINLASEPGSGTTVRFTIPVKT